jgi:hypothetical protein
MGCHSVDDPIFFKDIKGGRASFTALHVLGQLRGVSEFLSLASEHLSRHGWAKRGWSKKKE